MDVFMAKLTEKKEVGLVQAFPILTHFELDKKEEFVSFINKLVERAEEYNSPFTTTFEEAIMLQTVLMYCANIPLFSRASGIKVATLEKIKNAKFDNLALGLGKLRAERSLEQKFRIMGKADDGVELKLNDPMLSAPQLAQVSKIYFEQSRILTGAATSITETRTKNIYDDESKSVEERIRDLEREITQAQAITVEGTKV